MIFDDGNLQQNSFIASNLYLGNTLYMMIQYAWQGVTTAKQSGVYDGDNIFRSNAAEKKFPAQYAFPISLTALG
jgi:hypothetical protein